MDSPGFTWQQGRWTFRVRPLSLACCALEVDDALIGVRPDAASPEPVAPAGGPAEGAGGGQVHVLVVAGTVTEALAPAVAGAYAQLPEPRRVLAYGACATTGGPYWDSYSVRNGVEHLIPVDVVVPGCPPRPEALTAGLRALADRLDAGADASTEVLA